MESIEGAVDAGAVPSESLGRDDQDGREASYATKTSSQDNEEISLSARWTTKVRWV